MFLITKTISLFDRVKGTLFGKTTSEGVVSKAVLNPPHIERAEINIQKPEPLGVSPAPLKTNAFSKFLISKNWIRVTSFGTGVMTAASIGFLSYLMGTGVVAGMTAAVSSMLLSIFIFYAAMTAFFKKTTDQAIFHALPDFAKTAQITDKPAINKLHPSKEVPATIGTGFTSNQGASPGALQQQLYNRIFQKMTPIDQHIGGIRFSFRISMFGEGQQQTAAGRVQYLSPKTLENFSGHSAAEIEGRLRKIDWSQKWVEQLLNHSKTVTENEAYENLAHAVHRMTQVLQNKTFLNNDSANYFVDTSRGMELGLQFMHFKSQEIFKVVEKQFSNSKSGDLTPAKTNQELMALVLASRSRQVDYIEEALQNSWHVYDSDGALEKDIRFKLSSYLSKNYTPALNKRVEKISIEDNDYQLKKEELIRAVEKAILESFSALAIDEVGGIKDKKTFLSDFAAAAVHEMLFGYATVQAAEKSFIYLNQKEEDTNTLAALAAYFIPVLYPEVLTKERDFAQRRQKIEEVLREIKKDNQKINQKVNRTMSAQLNTRDFNKKEFAATLEYSLARIFAERVGDADFISEAGLGDMYARGFLKENLKNVNALIEPQVELNINVSPEFETWITSQSGRFALKEIVNAKPGSKEKTLVINGKVDARDVLALLENNPALNIKQKKSLYGQLSKQKTTVSDVAIPRKDKEKLGELKKIFRAERHRIKFSAKEKKLYFYGEISEAEKNRLQELLPEQYYSLEAAYSLSKDKGVGALLSNGGMRKAVYNQLYFADLSDDPTDLKTYRATAEKVKSEKALFLAENANQITLMSEIIHLEIVKLYEKYYAGLSKALSTSTGIKLWEKEEVYWRGLTEEWLKHMEANPFLQKYFSEAQTENFKNGLSQIVQKVLNPQHEMMVFGATGTLHHLHQFKGFAELDLTETVANIFSKKIPLPVFPQVYFEDEKENARFESTLENFIQAVQGNSTVGNKYFDLDVLARDLPQIIEDGIVLADNPGTIAFKKGSQFMNRYMLNERSRIALFSEAELAKGGAPSGRVKALVALRDFFNKSTLNSDQKKQLIEHAQHFIIYQKELSLIKMELLSRIRSKHVPEEIENVLLEKIYKHIVKGLKSHRSALSASFINEILSSETFMESIKPQELLTEIYFKNSDFEGGITKNKGAKAGVRSKRVGGSNYQIPVEVRDSRKFLLASRWLIDAARGKKGKPMHEKLAEELLLASNNEGSAVKKKEDVHKMAESNKAFAHFAR
jgi:small subunit ribosomal protein S7